MSDDRPEVVVEGGFHWGVAADWPTDESYRLAVLSMHVWSDGPPRWWQLRRWWKILYSWRNAAPTRIYIHRDSETSRNGDAAEPLFVSGR